jgi:hypothetical protein
MTLLMKPIFPVCLGLAISFGLTAPSAAWAITGVDELSDVPASHWAYDATQTVVSKGLMQGYPDGSFRGGQPTSRYETATVLKTLVRSLERDLSQLDATKANQSEVSVLSKLHQELKGELQVVEGQTRGLEERAKLMDEQNQEQNRRLSLLERVQLHGDMTFGVLSDMGANGIGRGSRDGLSDAISSVGRLRLTLDVPVIDDQPESKLGAGVVHTRLIGAYGRYAPTGGEADNLGANYPFNLYSRVAADVSAFNEGYNTGSVGSLNGQSGNTAMTRPNLYIESAYYTQHYKSGIPVLSDLGLQGKKGDKWATTGDLYVGLGRWWDLFDISPYRGNEMTQFQNNAFINIPGIAVNYAMPMAGYTWHQGLGEHANLDIATAVGSVDVGDAMDTLNVTYEGRLNYVPAFLGEKYAKPGTFYVGGYNIFNSGNRRFINQSALTSLTNRSGQSFPGISQQNTTNAVYMGWNQEWMRGIGTSVGYLWNGNSANVAALTTMQPGPATVLAGARQSFSTVMNIPVSALGIKKRPKDAIGIGYAFADLQRNGLSGNYEYRNRLEQVVEGYYRWQINDSVNVIPSVQIIANRLGLHGNGFTTVLGLRLNYVF